MLAASAAALPALLATASCRSSDVFAGPDPLAGRPSLSHDVIMLEAVIAAEQAMIRLYRAAVDGSLQATGQAGTLTDLLAQHRQHLARLQARLVLPAGSVSASPSASPGAVPARVTMARLRAAEHASATGLLTRLVTVEPSLAQLFASIAASDATHVVALGG